MKVEPHVLHQLCRAKRRGSRPFPSFGISRAMMIVRRRIELYEHRQPQPHECFVWFAFLCTVCHGVCYTPPTNTPHVSWCVLQPCLGVHHTHPLLHTQCVLALHTHTHTHTNTHTHTHTCWEPRTRIEQEKRSRKLLRSCRAALDVFRSVKAHALLAPALHNGPQ